MIEPKKNLEEYRFERKFHIPERFPKMVEKEIKIHPSLFSEIYYERIVNNIYLDTNELSFYHENLAGIGRRLKIRVRWYGELLGLVKKPVLELKIKRGELGTKLSYPLKSFVFDDDFDIGKLRSVFLDSDLPDEINVILCDLNLSIVNRYGRRYYLSKNKKFRATLDKDLKYFKIGHMTNRLSQKRPIENNDTILEVKYNYSEASAAPDVCSSFPFRMTKFSKYVSGVECIAEYR